MENLNNFSQVNPNEANLDETQFTATENEAENKGKRALGIAGAVIGSIAAGGGVAYAINHLVQNHDQAGVELPTPPVPGVEEPQNIAQERVVVNNDIEVKPEEELEPDTLADGREVRFYGTEHRIVGGQEVTIGYMTINGKMAVVVDTDNDGVFDAVAYDENGDGELQANEVQQLPTEGDGAMTVAQFQVQSGEPIINYASNDLNDDVDVELVGIHEGVDSEGNPITVAGVTVGDEEVALIDVDHDGTFDYMAHDVNGDGRISEDEVFEIGDSDITVDGVASLPQNDNYYDSPYADLTSGKDSDVSIVEADEVYVADTTDSLEPVREEEGVTGEEDLSYIDDDTMDEPFAEDNTSGDDFGTMGEDGINV